MKALNNCHILTMAEKEYKNGIIIIEDGKIKKIGSKNEIKIPNKAEIIELEGKTVMPGMVDAHTHIGIDEEGIGWEGEDYNEKINPSTPHLRALDGINPRDQGLKDALNHGITTVMTGPGSANVIGGRSVVIKTKGENIDDMIIREPVGVKGAFGENPKKVYSEKEKSPTTRMATAAILRKKLTEAKNYLNRKENDEEFEPNLEHETLIKLIKKEIPLKAHAHRADDIMTAIRIAEEFNINLTLEHCTEGHKITDKIAEKNIPAIVGPLMTSRSKVELKDRSNTTPAKLNEAGVKIALMTDHPVVPIQYLPINAALAIKGGLPEKEALKAITINPAEILGISDQVGSLEPGKDADLVLIDGDPLDVRTNIEKVFVNGKETQK